jgi:hypothetical protein
MFAPDLYWEMEARRILTQTSILGSEARALLCRVKQRPQFGYYAYCYW